jgi:hypothetical protein
MAARNRSAETGRMGAGEGIRCRMNAMCAPRTGALYLMGALAWPQKGKGETR